MRFFDTDMQKTSKGIINALNLKESAASVKSQIHKDEPEEAPKETKEALVKKVQSSKIPTKQVLKEDITDIQNQIAELQDYLNNTPDISDDEKASIQSEIDELLDEVNFYDAGLDMEVEEPSEDDLHLGESEELTEAPNPENSDINAKILSTIKAKSDVEPKYYDDLVRAGLEVSPDKYNPGYWRVTGPNGKIINKDDFLGGKYAKFTNDSKKAVDYYNYLTKEFDEDKYNHVDRRSSKPTTGEEWDRVKDPETGKYLMKKVKSYSDKPYNRRQMNSQGYNYDNLRDGTKNIRDFKAASDDYRHFKSGSFNDRFNDSEIQKAKQEYDDFQASISSKLAELKNRIDKATEAKQDDLATADRASAEKKEILNRVKSKRNQNQ